MRKVRVLFWLLLFSSICWSGVFSSDRIGYGKEKEERAMAAEWLLAIARKDLGIREEGCGNCGRRVEEYLKYVGFGKGAPWCAAAISMWFKEAGHQKPRTAWSPAMFPKDRVCPLPPGENRALRELSAAKCRRQRGLILGIYSLSLKRIAHVGLVENIRDDYVYSIEANTNIMGSREGDGVYRKIRHKKTIYKYADWL